MTFTKMFPTIVHFQMGNIVALSYLKKGGRTHNKILSNLAKEIWDYLLASSTKITMEYQPDVLNQEADF